MLSRTLRLPSFFLLASLLASSVACGARTDIPGEEDLDGSVVPDAIEHDSTVQDSPVADVTIDAVVKDVTMADVPTVDVIEEPPPPPPPPPPSCGTSCTHNYQCELTCAPLPSGRWCCDEQVGTCYAWSGKHCPAQIFDAGFD